MRKLGNSEFSTNNKVENEVAKNYLTLEELDIFLTMMHNDI